jgi:PAS domain S-box-containing protein
MSIRNFIDWFRPPRFDDRILQWRALYLYIQTLVVFIVALLLVPIFLVFITPNPVSILPTLCLLPFLLLNLYLIRKGWTAPASYILLSFGAAAILLSMAFGGGIKDTNFYFLVLVIFSAGLLLGQTGALIYSLVAILGSTAFFLLESNRLVAFQPMPGILVIFLQQTITFVLVGVIVGIAGRTLFRAQSDARKELSAKIRAVDALQRSESRVRAVFHTAADIAFIVAGRTSGTILEFSPGAERMTGWRSSEAFGSPIQSLLPDPRPQSGLPAGEWPGDSSSGEAVFRDRAGNDRPCLYSTHILPVEENEQPILIVLVDITERKKSEEERRKLEQQVLHAQKLESLGVLAGGIAHDFNNLLSAILGNTDLALMKTPAGSPAQEYLHGIETASVRASELCRQLLAYSGKGRFKNETVDLNALIREMTQILHVSISKKANLRLKLTEPLPCIEADPSQIRQVVLNLVINASEAIADRPGTVIVATGTVPEPEGTFIFLEVRDDGCGMDEETRGKIFDPFFTTKFTGRGLGLAAVEGIVKGHKGTISVDSRPGEGTVFRITLPASGLETKPDPGPADALPKQAFKARILIVDDEDIIRTVLAKMLKMMGLESVEASNGREAIEIFRTSGPFDCVLMDLTMPEMDGLEALKELVRIDPSVRVILSSGYNEQDAVRDRSGSKAAAFIQKPYQSAALRTVLLSVLSPENRGS